jgi:hypothetical protein
MTCYYVAPILPAHFTAEEGVKADKPVKKDSFFAEVLTILQF